MTTTFNFDEPCDNNDVSLMNDQDTYPDNNESHSVINNEMAYDSTLVLGQKNEQNETYVDGIKESGISAMEERDENDLNSSMQKDQLTDEGCVDIIVDDEVVAEVDVDNVDDTSDVISASAAPRRPLRNVTYHNVWHLDNETYQLYLSIIPKWFHRHIRTKEYLRLFIKKNSLPSELRITIYHMLCNLKYLTHSDVRKRYRNLYYKLSQQTQFSSTENGIRKDLCRTFPEYSLFKTDEGKEQLFRILKSYGVMDSIVGYTQGMAFVGGFLLCLSHWGVEASTRRELSADLEFFGRSRGTSNASSILSDIPELACEDSQSVEYNNEDTNSTTTNTEDLYKHCHSRVTLSKDSFYEDESNDTDSIDSDYNDEVDNLECSIFWIFTSMMNNRKWDTKSLFVPDLPKVYEVMYCIERVISTKSPTLYEWLKSRNLNTEIYATQFVMTLCTNHFKRDVIERIWDLFFLEGWIWIIRLVSSIIIENEQITREVSDISDFVPRIYKQCSIYTPDEVIQIMDNYFVSEEEYTKILLEYNSQQPDRQQNWLEGRRRMKEFLTKYEHLLPEEMVRKQKIELNMSNSKRRLMSRILNTFRRRTK